MAIRMNPKWQAPRVGAKQIKLLQELSNAAAVSGDEGAVRQIVIDNVSHLADDLTVDAMGNVLVTKKGKGRDKVRVMLAAHMDEIGLILTYDDGEGLFRFEVVGNIDPRTLPGKPLRVGTKGHPGVIGAKPIHLTTSSELKTAINSDGLRVDLGPGNSSKAKVGERAVFDTRFQQLGPSLVGKALDDRIGVATLITMVQNAPDNIDLLAAFTVQEELGLRGAVVAGYAMEPDLAIALDCTPALDHPLSYPGENTEYRSKLDGGPAIYVGDGATLGDPRIIRHMTAVGDAYKIKYQLRQPGGGGTDAGAIHKTRGGVPSISISVPGRYLHTAVSLARLDDWKNSIALLHAGLSHMDKNLLKPER
jgi:endoglucanase